MGKPRPQGSSVRVFRFGRAKDPEAVDRVRWAYALFLPEESMDAMISMLASADSPGDAIGKLMASNPDDAILGAEAVRRKSQRDPQLRRALRDARQALRQGSRMDQAK